jgi:hypothetical protein
MDTRYIILDETKTKIVRNYNDEIMSFNSYIDANYFASGLFGSWAILEQEMKRGIWMTTNLKAL